jgi:hypothetical protein
MPYKNMAFPSNSGSRNGDCMIIALLTLAIAMIAGGLLATILGWDIVLVERGWTMVIAGSISAASGALLLGITAAVSKLADIKIELMHLHAGLNEPEPVAATPPAGLSLATLAGGLFGGAAFGTTAKPETEEQQPTLPLFPEAGIAEKDVEAPVSSSWFDDARAETVAPPEPETPAEPEPSVIPEPPSDEDVQDAKVPDFLLADRYREPVRTPPRIFEPDEPLDPVGPVHNAGPALEHPSEIFADEPVANFSSSADRNNVLELHPEPGPEPESQPEPELEPAAPAVEPAHEEPHPASTIIGTYNSGDNKYVMFSDGSIEAETPQGVFHFNSLDELKEFIASGGEDGRS